MAFSNLLINFFAVRFVWISKQISDFMFIIEESFFILKLFFSLFFLDVTVDVNVLTPSQCAEMNAQSIKYGMVDDDFIT